MYLVCVCVCIYNVCVCARARVSRLFHRLKIRRFSSSLAELFLAPPIAPLSVESRSVPAVVSTSRLLLIFNLWAAKCTRCFLYFKWVFPVVNILMLWCMFAVFQCCFVLYVLCVYCAHFHSLHERPSCQNGILSLHPPVSFSLRVRPDFKWVLPVADILMLWCIYVVLLRKKAASHNNRIRFVLFECVLCTMWCFV